MTHASDEAPQPVEPPVQQAWVPLSTLSVGPPPEPEPAPVGMDPASADEDEDEDSAALFATFAQRRRGGGAGSCGV